MNATPEELAKYKARAEDYERLTRFLEYARPTLEKHPAAMAGMWAIEARELAKRWANETRGGL